MENTEIMNNDVVTAAMEEIVPASSKNWWSITGKLTVVAGVVYLTYKGVTKVITKIKNKKQETIPVECCEPEYECVDEVE